VAVAVAVTLSADCTRAPRQRLIVPLNNERNVSLSIDMQLALAAWLARSQACQAVIWLALYALPRKPSP
jgi:hypothetical protein